MLKVYLDFVRERHRIWQRRYAGQPAPWTSDPILLRKKFTNVFRVLDHGSQFVVRELLYGEDVTEATYADALARCALYRYTNRPEPWEFFHVMHGRYPLQEDLDSGEVLRTWRQYREAGGSVFGNAYKMFSGAENKGTDRLTWAAEMARTYFGRRSEDSIGPSFARLSDMKDRLALLQTVPRCAGFMSMQIVTDMGYSLFVRGDEDEHVIAGPGAQRGAKHVSPDDPETTIRRAQKVIHEQMPEVSITTTSGRRRPPSLMDVQNTFCEFSKYVRYMSVAESGEYRPAHPGRQPTIVLPAHW